ncbi:VQ motif-containing protein [Artemisia annua]|uniref:VQ motif-containing protein n=1 Tax=Artemisia annua TaxID=35608 RepID=A0A2U1PV27_ARTAN|nr:VQ motif-containing protein [Artemisia annua]
MDSGNSGSLPSSSGGDGGGDDLYDDSRRSNDQPLFAMQQQQPNIPPSSFFDTTSFTQQNHINPNPNNNPMYNLDSLWSRNPSNNQNPNPTNPVFNAQNPVFTPQNPVEPDAGPAKTTNPKKRTRASRRAPTTVLTTDTTNFRQMVQEFTGIFNLPPSEMASFAKQPLNLSSLQNQLFPFQTVVNNQQNLEGSTSTSVKRWRGESENMGNLEGGNGNNQNVAVLGRNEGHEQLPGNEDSWNICPSD